MAKSGHKTDLVHSKNSKQFPKQKCLQCNVLCLVTEIPQSKQMLGKNGKVRPWH